MRTACGSAAPATGRGSSRSPTPGPRAECPAATRRPDPRRRAQLPFTPGPESRGDRDPEGVAAADTGDIFLTPQQGPLQNGPMILAPDGTLVWFHPDRPPATWPPTSRCSVSRPAGDHLVAGRQRRGPGYGEDVIDDSSYRRLAIVHGANGLSADLHEFQLTSAGTALITAYYPVYWDASSSAGPGARSCSTRSCRRSTSRPACRCFSGTASTTSRCATATSRCRSRRDSRSTTSTSTRSSRTAENLIISARNTAPSTPWPHGPGAVDARRQALELQAGPGASSRSSMTCARPQVTGR